jgi:hypothetical protein
VSKRTKSWYGETHCLLAQVFQPRLIVMDYCKVRVQLLFGKMGQLATFW